MMFLGFNLYAWITIATVLSMFTAANILIVNIIYPLTPLQ